ncbi:hypothetical protein [Rhodoferax sp.]|uniref:hypothetical protein n=1 Tax=Rhodoferax sp. TaxID=50421 RepID=UPI00271B8DF2|nr:hypothetical protein [Rhodoferax sp.]MDO9194910.1 hypothetical protein [Rhodoferax sp.]
MKKSHPPIHQIEIRLAELSQLFNSMDPTPFHHRDLDTEAERFLESWALEFPQDSHFRIIVHIEEMPQEDPAALVATAIHNHFEYKSLLAKRNLRVLLLEGRTSLLIGLGFLGLCLLGADLLSSIATNTFLKILKESLLIGGWVAMWRPLQIFLYEWWPIVRRSRIYRNLGRANVHVTPVKAQQ